jgi:tripartite-type tricarboxylate transporter receptor subunit TctC
MGAFVKLQRRKFLRLAAGVAALPAFSHIVRAQAYPSRPVRIIVGFPPAGGFDIMARLIGQWLSERLGQPFVIENRPGAGGNLGTEVVARAQADGYMLLLTGTPNSINTTLYEKLPFDFIRDIAPVAAISREACIVAVHPSFPAKTLPEFIAYAKANPGKVNMGSGGNGGVQHVFGELFRFMAGIDIVHVPYRGVALALSDLLGGQVQVVFPGMASSIQYVTAGRLRPLAVTSAMRSELLPDIPAVAEFVPGYEAIQLYGIGAPRSTPAEVVAQLNKQINVGLADRGLKSRLAELGGAPAPMTPAEFRKHVAEETEKWGKVIRAANIRAG